MGAEGLRFVSIVGARPQFVKAAVFSRAVRARHREILVHTGQHYDAALSAVFFEEMGIPAPDVLLTSGSGTHAEQTAAMLVGIERVLSEARPDWVLTFGDTNSTLAGALAAAKLRLKVVHVEAGVRSFNRDMPEEVNRILVDWVSTVLLCPSASAVENLAREGIHDGVHLVGDVMAEALARAAEVARQRSPTVDTPGLSPGRYLLLTVHRAENTDDPERLRRILKALDAAAETVVFPVHPRTRKVLEHLAYAPPAHVRLVPPVGYIDMVRLLTNARLVLTDSGGVQKEAYWTNVPCVTLRDETEWIETVTTGWNVLTGADTEAIVRAMKSFCPPPAHPPLYGDTGVSARAVQILEDLGAHQAADDRPALLGAYGGVHDPTA